MVELSEFDILGARGLNVLFEALDGLARGHSLQPSGVLGHFLWLAGVDVQSLASASRSAQSLPSGGQNFRRVEALNNSDCCIEDTVSVRSFGLILGFTA